MSSAYRCSGCGSLNRVADDRAGIPVCGRCKRRLDTSGKPQDVDGSGFERTIESAPVPVLVDFWAPWCGPCRMAAPLVERAAHEHRGRLIVLKVNSDQNPELSARYGIQGIPAFLLFDSGRERTRQVGLPSPAAFADWVTRAIA